MTMMQTYVWVSILVVACQAIAIVLLSGVVGWFMMKRRLVDYDDFSTIKLLVDTNEKRLSVIENVIKPILSLSSTGGSASKEGKQSSQATPPPVSAPTQAPSNHPFDNPPGRFKP